MSASAIILPPMTPPDPTSTMMSMCTQCGNHTSMPDEANRRIKDLEAQVRLLNSKASAAVDKLADYEDEVRSLRSAYAKLQEQNQQQQQSHASTSASLQSQPQTSTSTPPPITDQSNNTPNMTPTASSPSRNASRLASLSSFLPGRKRDTAILQQPPNTPSVALFGFGLSSSPQHINTTLSETIPTLEPSRSHSQPQSQSQPPPLTLLSLQTSLETERNLRLRAESSLTQTQSELEELTATLFGQANEMVATERKARAKLEERVKVLEDRDGEKRRRLERLERALERIERVRNLVRKEAEESGKGETRAGIAIGIGIVGAGVEEPQEEAGKLRVVNNVVAVS